ncbi:MAG: UDP-N-acetylmuramate dehydrogenase [Abditibacteriota bacterium]|nr:UDP-N-acetylmuramate dehydrogenase [Abditibacteriota bacterium]
MLESIKGITVYYNEPLDRHTAMGVGGCCDMMVVCDSPEAVAETIRALRAADVPFYVFGGGTNLLVSDRGFAGAVVKLGPGLAESGETGEGLFVCGCAAGLTAAARASLEAGFTGLQEVGAVPGSLGGALYMNAGESLGGISRFVASLDVYDVERDCLCTLEAEECGYEYRNSLFQKNPGSYVLLSCAFRLVRASSPEELQAAKDYLSERLYLRKRKFPNQKSAGCFFKNPAEDVQAGRLIESCGLKGAAAGGARVAEEHANFIINADGASASDVCALAGRVRDRVLREKGVELEPEVRLVGDFSKTRVAVLMGGLSSERNISLVTGYQICLALNKDKYDVCGIDVAGLRPGWQTVVEKYPMMEVHREQIEAFYESGFAAPCSLLFEGRDKRPDVCFVALHGKYGEDGAVQGLLEMLGIPYTGSGILGHALAIDKAVSKKIYRQHGIPTPEAVIISASRPADARTQCAGLRYPLFIKPVCQGSTIGMTKVCTEEELEQAVRTAAEYDAVIMAEENVEGTEITVAVLDTHKGPMALPAIEIVPDEGLYDLEAKYVPGRTAEICPARLDGAAATRAAELALAAHRALGCRGVSRTDMIVEPGGGIQVLETNTIPGMTPTSLVPKALMAAGISFEAFLDIMIGSAQNET